MKCAIVSVGTEILFGHITNTNTVYLSQQLNLLGFDVLYHYTVGDNDARLSEILELALRDCDLVVTTGGLGPTEDDMTKETIAHVMGRKLERHEPSYEALLENAKVLDHPMTDNNYKQAMQPEGATVFSNEQGTAPGFAIEDEKGIVAALPGPPREMTWMYQNRLKPFLEKYMDSTIFYKTVRVFGIGESSLETKLIDLIDEQTDPTIAPYAKEGECTLRVCSKRKDPAEAQAAVDEMIEKIRERIGEFIYSTEGDELVEVVGRKLMESGLTISSAESCTGGLFSGTLTEIAGISAAFDRAIVTYSNEAKMEQLGVSEETLKAHGAVSPETAKEMAEGLHEVSGTDICISVTGVSGPGGGSEEKPVGLAYIGLYYKGNTEVFKVKHRNVSRSWNRRFVVLSMLNKVNKLLDSEANGN